MHLLDEIKLKEFKEEPTKETTSLCIMARTQSAYLLKIR